MPKVAARDRDAFLEKRRDELVEAALALWAERGYDGTSVEAIARRAGLSKGSFYVYFPSKLALLEQVVRRHSLQLPLERTLGELQGAPLEEVVPRLARAIWRHFRDRRPLMTVLLREMPSHLELARHFVEVVVLPVNRLFAAYLETRLGEERSRELDLLIAGRGLIGMLLVNFLLQEVLGGGKLVDIPDEKLLQTVGEVFLHGVRGEGGAS
jgi:AcrR family transcriptional regulator